MICMRYYFEAYSQPTVWCKGTWYCCLWYVWDTILKPIHNYNVLRYKRHKVVYDMYEILFWSLFTTLLLDTWQVDELFMICMRYYFEAYSQRIRAVIGSVCVVYDMYEILFWSLFTTTPVSGSKSITLFMIRMRYYFEAYSQLPFFLCS